MTEPPAGSFSHNTLPRGNEVHRDPAILLAVHQYLGCSCIDITQEFTLYVDDVKGLGRKRDIIFPIDILIIKTVYGVDNLPFVDGALTVSLGERIIVFCI